MEQPLIWQHTVSRDGAVITVRVSGELDMASEEALRELLLEHALDPACQHLAVDLEQVSFMDSTTVSTLLAARQRALAGGCKFLVVNPSRQVARVLAVMGLLDQLC